MPSVLFLLWRNQNNRYKESVNSVESWSTNILGLFESLSIQFRLYVISSRHQKLWIVLSNFAQAALSNEGEKSNWVLPKFDFCFLWDDGSTFWAICTCGVYTPMKLTKRASLLKVKRSSGVEMVYKVKAWFW